MNATILGNRVGMLFCAVVFTAHANLTLLADDEVQAFVRKIYTHGFPYSKAKELNRNSVGALLEMLRDPADKPYWVNIVSALGIIGDEKAVEPLIAFLERDVRGEVDSRTVSAFVEVPRALGHIAGNGSKKALTYLLENATLESWGRKNLPWTYGDKPGTAVFATGLYTSVIVSLGISAQPGAIARLEGMKKDSSLHSDYRGAANEALELADDINKEGRLKVFSAPRRPPRAGK